MNRLTVSEGNTKLGTIPNLNLPPGPAGTCRPDAICFAQGCYARKAWLQYPAVRRTWKQNWELWQADPQSFEEQLNRYLARKTPARFRWHSGGDIPDQAYFEMMKRVARANPSVRFLVFTKKYELNLRHTLPNLSVLLSRWPGIPFPKRLRNRSQAHFTDGDQATGVNDRRVSKCSGTCKNCDVCWALEATGGSVLFEKH